MTTHSHWRDRPVLVTGATGFLGGWLVDALVRSGAAVTAIVRDAVPQSMLFTGDALRAVHVVRGDVRNQSLLERVMGEYEIDTVFHLAAQTTVVVANRNPVSTFETNLRGTWAVLEAARRSQLHHITFATQGQTGGGAASSQSAAAAPSTSRR